jgi:para-aminobenzoate synthetase component 1
MDSVQLPYHEDSRYWFEKIRALAWPILLHSADGKGVDIISAEPGTTLSTKGDLTGITTAGQTRFSTDDPFLLLKETLDSANQDISGQEFPDSVFSGGALGYFGYDLGRRIEKLPSVSRDDIALPDMAVGIYDWSLETNHQKRTCQVHFLPTCPLELRLRVTGYLETDVQRTCVNAQFQLTSHMTSNFTPVSYQGAFGRILDYILGGDCYQVNLAQRFSGAFCGDPWSLYKRLSAKMAAPFSAYMSGNGWSVLSFSPERFLSLDECKVFAQPIKGTRPRSSNQEEDKRLALELVSSSKDRAENLMIVDLLRNDLGRSCVPGSIRVPDLFRHEQFVNVHHLVSDIRGELDESKSATDLLRGCFPGGSITGAPKIRAMEIIDELEPNRRSVYCGSIGYIGFDGSMDTNIAIRTLVCDQQQIHCWAGGGIVADSEQQLEYEETFHKINALLEALEFPADTRI